MAECAHPGDIPARDIDNISRIQHTLCSDVFTRLYADFGCRDCRSPALENSACVTGVCTDCEWTVVGQLLFRSALCARGCSINCRVSKVRNLGARPYSDQRQHVSTKILLQNRSSVDPN